MSLRPRAPAVGSGEGAAGTRSPPGCRRPHRGRPAGTPLPGGALAVAATALLVAVATALLVAVAPAPAAGQGADAADRFTDPREVRLENVRQLTRDGENAEAYFSFDGERLVFQRTPRNGGCDQIYTMGLDGSDVRRVSTGRGRTTCSYFYPSGERILYSSTHHYDASCPAPPDFSRGYVWALYPSYDIFAADADGSNPRQLTDAFGYDAEATVSPTGDRVVFTSMRDGDLDLYTMNLDGSDVRRVTDTPGYDGGAFFSPDGTEIVYRAHHPETEEELADYRSLLAEGLIRPTELEIYVIDADGSNRRQVTDNGAANFAPYWHPSGEKIVFSSNVHDPSGRDFDLYLIDVDGTALERVTWTDGFDGFPVFSPDGTKLVWGSNRNQAREGETNVFIAEWVEGEG